MKDKGYLVVLSSYSGGLDNFYYEHEDEAKGKYIELKIAYNEEIDYLDILYYEKRNARLTVNLS